MKITTFLFVSMFAVIILLFVLIVAQPRNQIIKVKTFISDNVDLSFEYSSDWNVKLEGDLSSRDTDKYIYLDNIKLGTSMVFHLYKDSKSASECEKYNDCGLAQIVQFEFKANDFEKLLDAPLLYVSSLGGIEPSANSDGTPSLLGIPAITKNSYYAYTLTNGKLDQAINIKPGVYLEISYDFETDKSIIYWSKFKPEMAKLIASIKK